MSDTVPAADDLAQLRLEFENRWHIKQGAIDGYFIALREPQRALTVEAAGAASLRRKIAEIDRRYG